MDAGSTIPLMESAESSLEQRPGVKHKSRDGGGRERLAQVLEQLAKGA